MRVDTSRRSASSSPQAARRYEARSEDARRSASSNTCLTRDQSGSAAGSVRAGIARVLPEAAEEPGLGQSPLALGGRERDAHDLGRLLVREAAEEPQLDHARLFAVALGQRIERGIQRQQVHLARL